MKQPTISSITSAMTSRWSALSWFVPMSPAFASMPVRRYPLSTRCERAADWTRMRMPGDQPAGRSRVRWFVALVAATIIAAIPTRITSHDFALGIPFTWRTRQTLVASADELRELHSLNWGLLLLDIAIVLTVLVALRFAINGVFFKRRPDANVS